MKLRLNFFNKYPKDRFILLFKRPKFIKKAHIIKKRKRTYTYHTFCYIMMFFESINIIMKKYSDLSQDKNTVTASTEYIQKSQDNILNTNNLSSVQPREIQLDQELSPDLQDILKLIGNKKEAQKVKQEFQNLIPKLKDLSRTHKIKFFRKFSASKCSEEKNAMWGLIEPEIKEMIEEVNTLPQEKSIPLKKDLLSLFHYIIPSQSKKIIQPFYDLIKQELLTLSVIEKHRLFLALLSSRTNIPTQFWMACKNAGLSDSTDLLDELLKDPDSFLVIFYAKKLYISKNSQLSEEFFKRAKDTIKAYMERSPYHLKELLEIASSVSNSFKKEHIELIQESELFKDFEDKKNHLAKDPKAIQDRANKLYAHFEKIALPKNKEIQALVWKLAPTPHKQKKQKKDISSILWQLETKDAFNTISHAEKLALLYNILFGTDELSLGNFNLFRNDIEQASDEEKLLLFSVGFSRHSTLILELAEKYPHLWLHYLGETGSYQFENLYKNLFPNYKMAKYVVELLKYPDVKKAIIDDAQRSYEHQEKWLNRAIKLGAHTKESEIYARSFVKMVCTEPFLKDYQKKLDLDVNNPFHRKLFFTTFFTGIEVLFRQEEERKNLISQAINFLKQEKEELKTKALEIENGDNVQMTEVTGTIQKLDSSQNSPPSSLFTKNSNLFFNERILENKPITLGNLEGVKINYKKLPANQGTTCKDNILIESNKSFFKNTSSLFKSNKRSQKPLFEEEVELQQNAFKKLHTETSACSANPDEDHKIFIPIAHYPS